jgi:hypothetical protein
MDDYATWVPQVGQFCASALERLNFERYANCPLLGACPAMRRKRHVYKSECCRKSTVYVARNTRSFTAIRAVQSPRMVSPVCAARLS